MIHADLCKIVVNYMGPFCPLACYKLRILMWTLCPHLAFQSEYTVRVSLWFLCPPLAATQRRFTLYEGMHDWVYVT